MAPMALFLLGFTVSATGMIQGLPQADWSKHHHSTTAKQSLRNAGTLVSNQARQPDRDRILPVVPSLNHQGVYPPSTDASFDVMPMNKHANRRLDLLWTPWTNWSLCSRSCGGGTAMRTRRCKKSPPAMCDGPRIDYMLCNKQRCPPGTPSFREQQCSQHGNRLRGYDWIPYPIHNGQFTCQLYCMAKNQRFIQRFGIAMDGTRCGRHDKDLCVGGVCVKVGCDATIGSPVKEDACGVCGGNNATCYHFKNSSNKLADDAKDFNYNIVAKIPAGATHIFVKDYSTNFLALYEARDVFPRYVVNGNKLLSWPGEFKTAGTSVVYTRVNDTETFTIEGPTKNDLYIMVLYLGQQPKIEYEYWIPNSLRHPEQIWYTDTDYNSFDEYHLDLEPEVPDLHVAPTTSEITTRTTTTTTTTKTPTTTATSPKPTTSPTTTTSGSRSPKGAGQPKPRTSLPLPAPLVNKARRCKKPKNRKLSFCESDFAITARVISRHRLKHGQQYRYDVEVLATYKSVTTLMEREYVWVPSSSCPKLRPLRVYLLMGHQVKVDITNERGGKGKGVKTTRRRFETRLTITESNYWAKWKNSYGKSLTKISNKLKCEKYLLGKKQKGKKSGPSSLTP